MKISRYVDRLDGIFVPGERGVVFAKHLGVPEGRIFRGMLGFDYKLFECTLEQRLAGEWPRRFVYLGRYSVEKSLDVLAAGYAKYRATLSDPWPLACFGSGPMQHLIENREGIEVNGWVQPPSSRACWRHGASVLTSQRDAWGWAGRGYGGRVAGNRDRGGGSGGGFGSALSQRFDRADRRCGGGGAGDDVDARAPRTLGGDGAGGAGVCGALRGGEVGGAVRRDGGSVAADAGATMIDPRMPRRSPSSRPATTRHISWNKRSVALSAGAHVHEYFVYDAASTDGSVEIIKRYAADIDHWVSEKDKGQSDAIHRGFARQLATTWPG